MSKHTVTTCVRRIMRAAGAATPKAKRGERTEAEKAVSRAQGKRKPRKDMSALEAEARVWALAFGGDVEPEPTPKVIAPLPVIPATPPAPKAVVTAPQATVSPAKPTPVAKAPEAVTVAPGAHDDVTHLGALTPGVKLTWDKAGKPTLVTYAGRDNRGRVAVTEIGANGNIRMIALPAWLLTRAGV